MMLRKVFTEFKDELGNVPIKNVYAFLQVIKLHKFAKHRLTTCVQIMNRSD